MSILQSFLDYFSKGNTEPVRYSDWKIVEHNIPGFTIVDGKEVIRMVDVYERYDNLNKEYEIKKVYKLPNRFTFPK